jgi:hypothetical protein
VDPNEALAQAREAVKVLQGSVTRRVTRHAAEERLVEAFAALDGWLVCGGFPPAAWYFAPEGDNHHNAALCPYCSPRP